MCIIFIYFTNLACQIYRLFFQPKCLILCALDKNIASDLQITISFPLFVTDGAVYRHVASVHSHRVRKLYSFSCSSFGQDASKVKNEFLHHASCHCR